MNSIKNTTLLEAVASAIQYEKDGFDFYLKAYETVKNPALKDFFQELAESVDEHIKNIQEMYSELKGGAAFPNLKQLTAVHKFNSSTLAKLVRRIDKATFETAADDLDAVERAMRISEEARDFYTKTKDKFKDPQIKVLFNMLASFSEGNRIMVESQYLFLQQKDKTKYYWEDDTLMQDAGVRI